jgi:LCP family protein required for cell wall assembly
MTQTSEERLRALGVEMRGVRRGRNGPPPKRPRSRRSQRLRRTIVVALAIVLVLVVGGVGYVYYVTHDLRRINVRGLSGAFTSGKEVGTENILMAGSTSRCALKVQNPAYGLCSQGVNGVNSDVIMILHVDSTHHRIALLSIPRDVFIPNARSTGPNKVDAALYQGLSQLVKAIEEDFGIPIQHAVSLNFDQFANIVDALGGINMSFPMSVFDAESGLNVRAAACVHLNGTQALEVVRARHLQYDAPGTYSQYAQYWPQENLSDLARIRRDHEFLRVLASAAAHRGLGNPISDLNLIGSLKADITFDQSWSVNDMAHLLLEFHGVDINSVPQLTLPVGVVTDPNGASGDLIYNGSSYGQVEFPAPGDQAVIDQVLGVAPGIDTLTGKKLPLASSVTVAVTNGTGTANQAADTASALAALGFKTVGLANSPPVGDVSETVVYYGSRSPTIEAAAERVLSSLSGSVVMAYDPSRVVDGAEVTVVTGSQFVVASPVGAPSSAPPSAAAIAAPTPSTSNLEPWDPRACAAGATPTAPVPNPT